jgi:hypothetical protein
MQADETSKLKAWLDNFHAEEADVLAETLDKIAGQGCEHWGRVTLTGRIFGRRSPICKETGTSLKHYCRSCFARVVLDAVGRTAAFGSKPENQ